MFNKVQISDKQKLYDKNSTFNKEKLKFKNFI